jgi:hypothetical protein
MLVKRAALLVFFLLSVLTALRAESPVRDPAPACQATPVLKTADSLASLSVSFFGNQKYRWSILLATNAHSAEPGYQFIRDPWQLPAGYHVCIPVLQEAERLRAIYKRYLQAVDESRLATTASVSNSLVSIDPHKPVKVVTWMRGAQVSTYKMDGRQWLTNAPNDIWVTVVPNLQQFCRQYAAGHSVSLPQLTERLEERLGLPPGAGKTEFMEITVADPSTPNHLFRPCSTPAINSSTCTPGTPAPAAGNAYKLWFLTQYYFSFGTAAPYSYPWTALGYTFDWGLGEDGRMTRYGESEFVIPQGAPIHIDSVTSTQDYCALSK